MPFKIIRNDITKMTTDAIVNTANEEPIVGAGCDSAIYNASGFEKLLEYRKKHIGYVPEGSAFITPAFNLPAKYILHVVSPLYKDGSYGEEEKLRSCYKNSLKLAKENNIKSIAFPLVSTGEYGYPKQEGMRIAIDEINTFILENTCDDMLIYIVVFDEMSVSLGKKIYPDLKSYIDSNYVEEKINEESKQGNLLSSMIRTCSRTFGSMKSCNRISEKHVSSLQTHSMQSEPMQSCGASQSYEAADEYIDFDAVHKNKLDERIAHMSDTYSQYLMYLIESKNLQNVDVWRNAIVDKKVFSKIKNNINYHPQKKTALCLCIGARLNLDESKDLLAKAGYALSPCDKTDIIFSYFIENEIYDMIELDLQLEEHGLPCLIQ